MAKQMLICDGDLQIDVNNQFLCSGQWLSYDASMLSNVFDVSTLDPVLLTGYFSAGLISVGVFLVTMIPARFIIDSLSKLDMFKR